MMLSLGLAFYGVTSLIFLNLVGRDPKNAELTGEAGSDDNEKGAVTSENSTVFTSLPLAISWLRDSVRKNHSVRFQVTLTLSSLSRV